ncbi:predicted protein [Histoplasma capsulatum H143]|uniref:Uncharacterized protein n=1 Tax=Ajellomyces capsulatus (strain H143) TaxID=544712 RepID=C6H636_AJECH|nr:predicted protein [Histoplasma capsulatum H143]
MYTKALFPPTVVRTGIPAPPGRGPQHHEASVERRKAKETLHEERVYGPRPPAIANHKRVSSLLPSTGAVRLSRIDKARNRKKGGHRWMVDPARRMCCGSWIIHQGRTSQRPWAQRTH